MTELEWLKDSLKEIRRHIPDKVYKVLTKDTQRALDGQEYEIIEDCVFCGENINECTC